MDYKPIQYTASLSTQWFACPAGPGHNRTHVFAPSQGAPGAKDPG